MPWLAGFPREKVEWYPTVDPSKCIKCGMCMNCGKSEKGS
jgi:ferredoxin